MPLSSDEGACGLRQTVCLWKVDEFAALNDNGILGGGGAVSDPN